MSPAVTLPRSALIALSCPTLSAFRYGAAHLVVPLAGLKIPSDRYSDSPAPNACGEPSHTVPAPQVLIGGKDASPCELMVAGALPSDDRPVLL
ncbi:hypothetical protein D3C72_1266580 [compost metagenome]